MSRYWYGNNAGFSVLTVSDNAPRIIRPTTEARNCDGPVRRYPVPWRCSATGRVGEAWGIVGDVPPETNRAIEVAGPVALDGWPKRGRRITYHPELTRAAARRLREQERAARQKGGAE